MDMDKPYQNDATTLTSSNLPTFTDHAWQPSYRTGRDDLATDFYAPAMARATRIERTSGYFRSTVFALLYEPLQGFLARNGHLSILCSPYLSPDDTETFHALLRQRNDGQEALTAFSRQAFLSEVKALFNGAHGDWHQKILGGMVRHGFLDIRIGVLRAGNGLFHEKLGVFHDAHGHRISFKGSVNETFSGWGLQGNIESIDTFYSWLPEDAPRVDDHHKDFLDVWEGRYQKVSTLTLGEAIDAAILEKAPDDPEEARALLARYQSYRAKSGVRIVGVMHPPDNAAKTLTLSEQEDDQAPDKTNQWPSGRVAAPHQAVAIKAWYEAGQRGIFEHATGSGKTFTALHIIRDHLRQQGVVLIVVPSTLLMKGWFAELSLEIPDANVVRVGGGHNRWRSPGDLEWRMQRPSQKHPLVMLATMQTAAKKAFRDRLRRLSNILLVADEVHQLGSDLHRQLLNLNMGSRLGLSATPERFGDPDGTAILMHYFGGIVGAPFTLSDAMSAGRLTQYHYHPETLSLNAEEADAWEELTEQLREAIQKGPRDENGKPQDNQRTRLLKIKRSRIAKKAAAKTRIAKEIIEAHYAPGQHWLVYCEDQEQLGEVAAAIAETGIAPWVYYADMAGDPDATLAAFRRHSGVIVSIRCLDEGVDIPEISHAIILASSQNPRQFIQRRGRVLRRSPGKHRAHIWDALVLPPDTENDIHGSLTRSELLRAIEFAEHAADQGGGASRLRTLAASLGLSVDEIYGLAEPDTEEDE
ncbi:DEAD/DEAH box helicase family protein [Vreelandella massiliensis]|uniref:DEAD/DEAH box helicase family protein n=1 Tax=Vreelandella massiliensis TaxID=1816686 RepID=UPI00096AA1D9|nr:DEAD/DEAH box helicase family protein [Halomonas massiliensis]